LLDCLACRLGEECGSWFEADSPEKALELMGWLQQFASGA
jgi:hypothetical protein